MVSAKQQTKIADTIANLQRSLGPCVEMMVLLVKDDNGGIGIVGTRRLAGNAPPEGDDIGQFLVDALAAHSKNQNVSREYKAIMNLETGERRILTDKKE